MASVVRLENRTDSTLVLDAGICVPPRGKMLVPKNVWETLQRPAHFLIESGDLVRLEDD